VRKQIGRLLDPSLQCAQFIYDELIKVCVHSSCNSCMLVSCEPLIKMFRISYLMQISHGCLISELQKFPVLKKRMSEVVCSFLRDGLRPAETMITHIIEMEASVYFPMF
jgi:dynamin GTPase/dynamin 1-like protein